MLTHYIPEMEALHWLDPGMTGVDTTHWLWAPEAIEALPWADKPAIPEAEEERKP